MAGGGGKKMVCTGPSCGAPKAHASKSAGSRDYMPKHEKHTQNSKLSGGSSYKPSKVQDGGTSYKTKGSKTHAMFGGSQG